MFKIAKLENLKNEVVSIEYATQEQSKYEDGKKVSHESFRTLTFDISGDDYSFSFDLNCRLEELLKIPMNETIDFKMENGQKYSLGYFKVLTIDEYNNMLAGNRTPIDMSSSAATLIKYYPGQLTGLTPSYENASYSIGTEDSLKVDLQEDKKNKKKIGGKLWV